MCNLVSVQWVKSRKCWIRWNSIGDPSHPTTHSLFLWKDAIKWKWFQEYLLVNLEQWIVIKQHCNIGKDKTFQPVKHAWTLIWELAKENHAFSPNDQLIIKYYIYKFVSKSHQNWLAFTLVYSILIWSSQKH